MALDDEAAMRAVGGTPVADAADATQNKNAVDAVFHAYSPDYLVVLGSTDVVPHQPLRNPVFDGVNDVDRLVPGDLAYACNAPFSDDASDFIGPDRVVGRLPDVTGAGDPAVLLAVLAAATRWQTGTRKDYESHLGVSALVWTKSTVLSLRNVFGAAEVHISPTEGPDWSEELLSRRVHFVNCHGADSDPQFYGQDGSNYPVSLRSASLTGHVRAGTVAAAECCYGAQLWAPAPADGPGPIPLAYLAGGAFGFLGSSTIAYGPADTNGDADLVCQYFVASLLDGASLGRATLEARQRFVRGVTVLSPVNTKTLAQFSLLGDPSIHPVADAPAAKALPARAGRAARRERLLEHAIANLRDTSVTRRDDDARHVPEIQSQVLADATPLADARVQSFSVARRRWRACCPRRRRPPSTPAPASASCSGGRGRQLPTGPASTSSPSRREEDGRIVSRRVLQSR